MQVLAHCIVTCLAHVETRTVLVCYCLGVAVYRYVSLSFFDVALS